MSHVVFSELADHKIAALKKEADEARLARFARASKKGPARRHKVYRPVAISALLQRY